MACIINQGITDPKHQEELCCDQKEPGLFDIPGERSEANDPKDPAQGRPGPSICGEFKPQCAGPGGLQRLQDELRESLERGMQI